MSLREKGETLAHKIEKKLRVLFMTLASSTVMQQELFNLAWFSWHVGWINMPDVNTLCDWQQALNGDCCIGVDFNDHEGALLGRVKFALNVFTHDKDIVSNVVIVRDSGSILTGVVIKDILLATSIDLVPVG